MLIDTHAHLYLPKFEEDRKEVMQRAEENGIAKIFLPNVDKSTIEDMLSLEQQYPKICFAMMGLHPCSVKQDMEVELKIVEEWLGKRKFCAIGEIGIDLYWDKSLYELQVQAFKRQINWAIDLDIPIVIHSRESTKEVIEILKELKHPKLRGIFHCFSGTEQQAKEIIDLGFYLGIGGVLTFKNSGLAKEIKNISLSTMVLETDAPYLAPTPFRGKRNESAYIRQIAEELASIKQLPFNTVAEETSKNALTVFGQLKEQEAEKG